LVISLFNGIGGCFRCYDIIGVTPAGRIAVDIDDAGNRVTQRRWPGTLLVKDVKTIDAAMVHSWSLKYLNVTEVHLWGGWPCVGLSAVRYGRQNLDGPQSSLFWEIPRIKDLLEKEFGATAVIKYVLENVASMDQHAAQQISHELGVEPYRLDCADAVPMRRPRYAWTSEDLTGVFSDVSITQRRYWWDVTASATYPRTEQWPTPGYAWDGEQDGCIFPTCMKSIPRTSPPIRPAGLEN
jgi:site-specific DNA-cytosine methylase